MSSIVDYLGPNDKPALLGLSTPEFIGAAEAALAELGYKSYLAHSHEDFLNRFGQMQYQAVIIEDHFAGNGRDENRSLRGLQWMPMSLRRHATILLISDRVQTLNAMQAFNLSVHCVLHPDEVVSMLGQLIQKKVADNDLFLNMYRETQNRIAQGKA